MKLRFHQTINLVINTPHTCFEKKATILSKVLPRKMDFSTKLMDMVYVNQAGMTITSR